jgi:NAD(P)-dependent dehydrogenase (short-subunit alcohol dehydrogenase family)
VLIDIRRTHLFIGKPDTEENRAGFVSTIPIGRPSTPSDVANACCYLASDEAAFITGVDLEVRLIHDILLPD